MRGHDKKLQQLFKKAAAMNEITINEKAIKGLVLWESQCGKKLLTLKPCCQSRSRRARGYIPQEGRFFVEI